MSQVKARNKQRIIIAFMLIMVLMVLLCFRMAWIQVVKAEEYSEKAINQQMTDMPIEANRGAILDRNGKALATSATCYSVWVRPAQLKDNYTKEKINELSKQMAVIIDAKAEDVQKKFTSKDTIVKVAKYLDKDQCDKIKKLDIVGLDVAENTKRYYPLGTQASQLLGSVNDDNEGRTGIEAQFDNYLSGVAGRWIKETDREGDTLSYGSQKYYQAQDGYDVKLTLDEVLQHYAESAVQDAMKTTRAKRIMCLVMDPNNGDILAMVTNPGFDPNDATEPVGDNAKAEFRALSTDKQGDYLSKMWSNPIVSDLYEPGSTFKLVTTSAALEEGVSKPKEKFNDIGYIPVDGINLHCWYTRGHGQQTLTQAVGNSCNTVQVELVKRLGKKKYYNYLEMFGITDTTHVSLPAETSAIIKDVEGLTNVDLATMSYGQGIAVTPLQILTAVCAIGNDGVMMKPRIVSELIDKDGKTIRQFGSEKVRNVISLKTSEEMRSIMEYVVEEGGGGNAKVPGYRIGGKTGTADKVVGGKYTKDTYSSFVGLAPMDDPRLGILVVVDSPKGNQFGSAVAAPVAKSFLQNAFTYLEISPKYTKEEMKTINSTSITLPDLKGKNYSDAIGILGKYGLKYQVSPAVESSTDFKIVDQYPKAGSSVAKGELIYLYRE